MSKTTLTTETVRQSLPSTLWSHIIKLYFYAVCIIFKKGLGRNIVSKH